MKDGSRKINLRRSYFIFKKLFNKSKREREILFLNIKIKIEKCFLHACTLLFLGLSLTESNSIRRFGKLSFLIRRSILRDWSGQPSRSVWKNAQLYKAYLSSSYIPAWRTANGRGRFLRSSLQFWFILNLSPEQSQSTFDCSFRG